MQLFQFDFWGMVLATVFYLTTCNSAPVSVKTHLVTPKTETSTQTDYSKIASKLTIVLLQGGKVYAYEGNALDSGKFVDLTGLTAVINAAKTRFNSPDFVVLIKPTAEAEYKHAVDVLDQMARNKITRYAIEDVTNPERQQFNRSEKTAQ